MDYSFLVAIKVEEMSTKQLKSGRMRHRHAQALQAGASQVW